MRNDDSLPPVAAKLIEDTLRYASDAVLTLQEDAGIVHANQAACDMFGYSLDALLQNRFIDLAPNLDVDSWSAIRERLLQDLTHYFETGLADSAGKSLPVEVNANVFSSQATRYYCLFIRDISSRKQAEKLLSQNSEHLLELFFSQSLDGFFFMMIEEPVKWDDSVDKDQTLDYVFTHQRMTKVNDAMLAQYGAKREQFLGLTPAQFYKHDVEYGKRGWRRFFDVGHLHVETHERKFDGTPMWVEGDYIALRDKEGRITGHFGIQREVTHRKQAEQALQQYNKRLQVLQEINKAILAAHSPEEIATAAMLRIQELVDCLRASVALFDLKTDKAELLAIHSQNPTELKPGADLQASRFGDLRLLEDGKVHIIADTQAPEQQKKHKVVRKEGVRSYINVPLLFQDELIGSLNIGSAQANAFSEPQIEIAREVANNLAVAIRQAQLNTQIARHASELEKRVEERTAALQKSEERYRALYDLTPVMMHSLDDQARIVNINAYWLEVMGYKRDEVIGRFVKAFQTEASGSFAIDYHFRERFLETGVAKDLELQFIKKQGEVIDVLLSAHGEFDENGSLLYTRSFMIDVTERKKAAQALQESERRFRTLYDNAPVMLHSIDAQKCLRSVNQFWLKTLGYDYEEVIGKAITDFMPDASRRYTNEVGFPRLLEKGFVHELELQLLRKDGQVLDILVSAILNQDEHGGFHSQSFLLDISDRKRAENLQAQNIVLQEALKDRQSFSEIIGESQAMQAVFHQIETVATTDSTVLLLGETGTGKELISRAIHQASQRKDSVMVKVNCGALPSGLAESELFGHEKGAFTGAVIQKKGRFELAHQGTIFLDEVGELSHDIQVKLLRVLQEKEFERVGGAETLQTNVRVIAATNRNLAEEVESGAFRSDLYYRLNIFPIEVPPLRARQDDVPLLANYFVGEFSARMGKRISSINKRAMELLQRYDWPGNVRELANILERAVILCQQRVLQPQHIGSLGEHSPVLEKFPTLEDLERRHILSALQKTGGVLAGPNGAAELLGINRSTLWSRMRKLGITTPQA